MIDFLSAHGHLTRCLLAAAGFGPMIALMVEMQRSDLPRW